MVRRRQRRGSQIHTLSPKYCPRENRSHQLRVRIVRIRSFGVFKNAE